MSHYCRIKAKTLTYDEDQHNEIKHMKRILYNVLTVMSFYAGEDFLILMVVSHGLSESKNHVSLTSSRFDFTPTTYISYFGFLYMW